MTSLESRRLLATYIVNSSGDQPLDPSMPPGETIDGTITLRSAIQQVDLDGGGEIYTDFTAPTTITPQSPLPAIDVPMDLDSTNDSDNKYAIISGQDLPSGSGPILSVTSTSAYAVYVLNLVIDNGPGDGIDVSGNNTLIDGDYIGTDDTGTISEPNAGAGVSITGSDNSVAASVISGNGGDGIDISGSSASGNVIESTSIGVAERVTNGSPTSAVANAGSGVVISGGAFGNVIGSTPADYGPSQFNLANTISGNDGDGVWIKDGGTTGNLVAGNFIGTDQYGLFYAIPNGSNGVLVSDGASYNTIGGTAFDYDGGNVISGNTAAGLEIDAADCQVAANLIGTDRFGSAAIGNGASGIDVGASGAFATIGGETAAAGNIIAANKGAGIFVQATCLVISNLIGAQSAEDISFFHLGNTGDGIDVDATDVSIGKLHAGNMISGNGGFGIDIEAGSCVVERNFIGTNPDGTSAVGNGRTGIYVSTAGTNAVIGGTSTGTGNIISANQGAGVFIQTPCLVVGNAIGADFGLGISLGNTGDGIVANTVGVTIGGSTAGAGNIISENDGNGITLNGTGAAEDLVEGNQIGTDSSGSYILGNTASGIVVATSGVIIGGTAAGDGNVISGNGGDGIDISGTITNGTTVEGNSIGTNITGELALGNSGEGIDISGGSSGDMVADNTISANDQSGVVIEGFDTSGDVVQDNKIGTDVNGAFALGNAILGVQLSLGATEAMVVGNVISGNGFGGGGSHPGINIEGTGTTGNSVIGNFIGTNASGTAAIPNFSSGVGIRDGASSNTIGGTSSGDGNVISGNGEAGALDPAFGYCSGVDIGGAGTTGNLVEGNFIGTDITGTQPLGNLLDGVHIQSDASNNTIGGTSAGAANIIAFNGGNGVLVGLNTTDDSINNAILENAISSNTDLGINLGNESSPSGTPVGGTPSGPNNLQNAPILTSALNSEATTTIAGTLSATPSTTFRIELFSNPAGTSEGETYLGYATVTTGATGQGSFSFSPASLVPLGLNITATATDPDGNTSEFSTPLTIETAPTNITPDLSVTYFALRLNPRNGLYTEPVEITNTSNAAIKGPISMLLLDLENATLDNETGVYMGSPYITVLTSGSLGVGKSLAFSLIFADPAHQPITYTGEFLAGTIPNQGPQLRRAPTAKPQLEAITEESVAKVRIANVVSSGASRRGDRHQLDRPHPRGPALDREPGSVAISRTNAFQKKPEP